jgi:hypothetical protein
MEGAAVEEKEELLALAVAMLPSETPCGGGAPGGGRGAERARARAQRTTVTAMAMRRTPRGMARMEPIVRHDWPRKVCE